MPSLPIYDMNKNKVGNIELSDAVFAAEVKPALLNDAVRVQIAKRYEYRTANARTRTEVTGSGKKIYKQKGTGQARHGDIRAPIFAGGGKAFGPHPRRVRRRLNKKTMRQALLTAISLNQKADRLFVIDKLELKKPHTKEVAACLKKFGFEKALLVNSASGKDEKSFNLSARNIRNVKCLRPEGLNVFDILKFKNLVLSKKAAEKITERLSNV